MIAALPMYLRPENRAAHDTLWSLIRDNLNAGGLDPPNTLSHDLDIWTGWTSPDLLLGQICNLPYRAKLRGKVHIVGLLDYGLPDAPPGYYYSYFVTHDPTVKDSLALVNARFVCNETLSQSGYGAPQLWAKRHGTHFANVTETGAHAESVRALKERRADIAAIDAITWNMLERRGETDGLHIIGQTDTSPGQSLITARPDAVAPLRKAISQAIETLPDAHRVNLGIRGLVVPDLEAYDLPLPDPPETQGQQSTC
ncbi:phosphate/phosphite/phosphonate ABC transporter substrate-binding protein [Aestuariibius insulae]|uniref:phosphate/phosphite/phosphonate ABC transporter substrate-binding protein n=1 Tax=Aestuariibius insulae TaxID=2058287 RepID=UPI00345ED21D